MCDTNKRYMSYSINDDSIYMYYTFDCTVLFSGGVYYMMGVVQQEAVIFSKIDHSLCNTTLFHDEHV